MFARSTRLGAATAAAIVLGLVFAPAAGAATGRGPVVVLGFLGLPSLHSIIEAIANGFFGALAGALVPSWLKHGTVAIIQSLVALPNPSSWKHVGQLQQDMTYLGVSLLPVTLAVGTLRYWMMGLTGAAHPASAIGRCFWSTGVLVAYGWIVTQVVDGTNTLTHAILGFPVVAEGLGSIITVLFGGALLSGVGSVFGAFLVIAGVVFAAGLFALQVALTLVLALLVVSGPPLIALSAIPELAHLGRAWAHALLAAALVPLAWSVLFATAGALTLDATDFTNGAQGLPSHIAAAFAALITFVIALKLPLTLIGQLRNLLGSQGATTGAGAGGGSGQSAMGGSERVRASHARLQAVARDGVPSLARSLGSAAGALGAPAGGALGASRRGLSSLASRAAPHNRAVSHTAGSAHRGGGRGGVGERARSARAIIARAPADARAAVAASARTARQATSPAPGKASRAGTRRPVRGTPGDARASRPPARAAQRDAPKASTAATPRTARAPAPSPPRVPPPPTAQVKPPTPGARKAAAGEAGNPGRRVTSNARREGATAAGQSTPAPRAGGQSRAPAPKSTPGGRAKRRPRPRRKP